MIFNRQQVRSMGRWSLPVRPVLTMIMAWGALVGSVWVWNGAGHARDDQRAREQRALAHHQESQSHWNDAQAIATQLDQWRGRGWLGPPLTLRQWKDALAAAAAAQSLPSPQVDLSLAVQTLSRERFLALFPPGENPSEGIQATVSTLSIVLHKAHEEDILTLLDRMTGLARGLVVARRCEWRDADAPDALPIGQGEQATHEDPVVERTGVSPLHIACTVDVIGWRRAS
jgi:hypothetical protein